ncbi:MAG: ribokinase [Rhodanobacter sp.]
MTVQRAGHVLVAGSANLDFVVRAVHVPAPGETVLGRELVTLPGGKGANQAVACARAGGAPTRMLLALGDDAFAKTIESSLRDAGVALELLRTADAPTGVAFVCLSDQAENAITVAPGANALLGPQHLPSLEDTGWLLLQLETPIASVEAWALVARTAGVCVALNAAPAQPLSRQLLDCVDLLIVNEGELAVLSGIADDIAAGMAAINTPALVVTLGARGVCARVDGVHLLQPAFAIKAVDTTGAGDTFCGTLVAALNQGLPFGPALRRAAAASALTCTRVGAQAGVPTHDAVDHLLRYGTPATTRDMLATFCGLAATTLS